MTTTVNLYYDYVIRGLSRREFLDALATEETDQMTKIKCGDHIRHEPSGEDWVVSHVNGDRLVCQGWPESMAKLSDCVLIKSCSFEEHIASLVECAKSSGSRAYHAQKRLDELAKETWPEEIWLQPDTIFYPAYDEDGYAGCSVAFSGDHGGFKYVRSDLVASLRKTEETDALVVDLHNRPVADDGGGAAADDLDDGRYVK